MVFRLLIKIMIYSNPSVPEMRFSLLQRLRAQQVTSDLSSNAMMVMHQTVPFPA